MVSGSIVSGETEQFDIESSKNWYVILTIENGIILEKEFNGSKREKGELIDYLEKLIEKNIYFRMYGIWNGRYNTDLFVLEPSILIKRLKSFLL